MLEYPRIARLHHWSRATIREFVAELAYLGIMTPGEITLNVVRTDPADNRYLECALEGTPSAGGDLIGLWGCRGVRRAAVRETATAQSAYPCS